MYFRFYSIFFCKKVFKEKKALQYMEKIEYKTCSRCNKSKHIDEFTEPKKLCDSCLEDKKEYRRCKKEGIEKVKAVREPSNYKTLMYDCPLCNCSVKWYRKAQHLKTKTHKRNEKI